MEEEPQFHDETCFKLGLSIDELKTRLENFNIVRIELVDLATRNYLFDQACQKSDSQNMLDDELRKTKEGLMAQLHEKGHKIWQMAIYNGEIDAHTAGTFEVLADEFVLGRLIDLLGRMVGGEPCDYRPWIREYMLVLTRTGSNLYSEPRLEPEQTYQNERPEQCRDYRNDTNLKDRILKDRKRKGKNNQQEAPAKRSRRACGKSLNKAPRRSRRLIERNLAQVQAAKSQQRYFGGNRKCF
ncbi:hypothetical protein FSARC_5285 [Fusarium sarcochroum]|uniref:Uncharacterized protein n=1 Tax=Fusarium sarcochroum TaxID=1208366 RepID=A0A8H4TZV7_9HYPO|nr:hypothetical protein FSARC_5285 [Fusarium sarcochroum]